MLAAKPVALKSMLIEMRGRFPAEYELCFALWALYYSVRETYCLVFFPRHHAIQLLGGNPTPFRFNECLSENVRKWLSERQNNLTDRAGTNKNPGTLSWRQGRRGTWQVGMSKLILIRPATDGVVIRHRSTSC